MSQRLVGVTGGIGSGKSIICRLFSILGWPVYNSDVQARILMHENSGVVEGVRTLFGDESYIDGQLNRKHIAEVTFRNKELLDQLNSIVHPAVQQDFALWVASRKEKVLIKESALLIETEGYQKLDELVVVIAPEPLRIQRTLRRDSHRKEKDIRRIIENQVSDEERKSKANHIVVNDDNVLVIPQVLKLSELWQ